MVVWAQEQALSRNLLSHMRREVSHALGIKGLDKKCHRLQANERTAHRSLKLRNRSVIIVTLAQSRT
jgi:hypothetical protein